MDRNDVTKKLSREDLMALSLPPNQEDTSERLETKDVNSFYNMHTSYLGRYRGTRG